MQKLLGNKMKKAIHTSQAPKAIGPYSQAIRTGNFLFVSGQIPLDCETGEIVGNEIEEQTKKVLQNLGAILKEVGLSYKDVVKTDVFLKDFNHFTSFNQVYEHFFSEKPFPARWAVEVARLPKDVLVEVGCVAVFQS